MNTEYFDRKMKTRQGIDKLQVMVKFMYVVESEVSKLEGNLNRFKSFLCEQLKRGITPEEELSLLSGIDRYIKSNAGENERLEAMDYLFELKFLKD